MSDLTDRQESSSCDHENDPISREAVLERIQNKIFDVYNYPKTEYAEGYVNACKAAVKMVRNLPTVNTVPVIHGKWIVYVISPFDGEDVKCSECGERGCAPYWDYCPHCGAKNDEVINENDN